MKSDGRSKNWAAGRAGLLLLLTTLVLLACTCGTGPFSGLLTPTSKPVPTPMFLSPGERGGYNVYVRSLGSLDGGPASSLIGRLRTLGYNVIVESATSTDGWSYPENAILYGNTSCPVAIEDIIQETRDIADLSTLPVYRFGSEDTSINAMNIVIQLIDDSHFFP
jgi:hypothetical protein